MKAPSLAGRLVVFVLLAAFWAATRLFGWGPALLGSLLIAAFMTLGRNSLVFQQPVVGFSVLYMAVMAHVPYIVPVVPGLVVLSALGVADLWKRWNRIPG